MKNILITGAGSGLGKELALKYALEDYNIILVGRNVDKLISVNEMIAKEGGKSILCPCDITKSEDIKKAKILIKEKYNSIYQLINCAGVGYFGSFDSLKEYELDHMLDLNVKATILMTQNFLELTTDKIMNIISTAGLRGKSNEAAYCATKFALRGFTESLALELREKNIKVTGVYMGGMDTPFWDKSDHIMDKTRLKKPSDIANEIFNLDDGRTEIIL